MRVRTRIRRILLRYAPRCFARLCTADTRELGELGEELAVRALLAHGFQILGRRVRTAQAEVDVVARERDELVCVEVKTSRVVPVPAPRGARSDASLAGFHRFGRLGSVQQARLLRAARKLAARQSLGYRVDLVEVVVNARTGGVRVEHRRDVGSSRERPSRSGGRDPG